MDNNFEHIDALIAKVISGEAGMDEMDELERWRRQDPANEEYFELSTSVFRNISGTQATDVDVDAAWNKLNTRINATPEQGRVISLQRNKTIFRAAAVLFLLLCFAFVLVWFLKPAGGETMLVAATDKEIKQSLPDGSTIVVSQNSKIKYTYGKNKIRQVHLEGEAFFEVEHKDNEPFIVEASGVMVRDIGTAFKVKAIPGSSSVEVTVEHGEVQFYTATNKGISLLAGEKAIYDKNEDVFKKETVSLSVPANSSRMLNFEATRLSEVVSRINAMYGSRIELDNPQLAHCMLSVNFNNERLETVLDVIKETLDLEIIKDGDRILIKGDGCSE